VVDAEFLSLPEVKPLTANLVSLLLRDNRVLRHAKCLQGGWQLGSRSRVVGQRNGSHRHKQHNAQNTYDTSHREILLTSKSSQMKVTEAES
jgi:hypothetical protein